MSDDLDQDIIEEIEDRKLELELEYDDDYVKINEILRDEYSDYQKELVHLKINSNPEDLGLKKKEDDTSNYGTEPSEKTKSEIIESVLKVSKRLKETRLALEGKVEKDKVIIKPKKNLVPTEEIDFIMEFLKTIYSPQKLLSKIDVNNLKSFDDFSNRQLSRIAKRIGNYPDHIVSLENQERVMQLILENVITVKQSILNGRLGDILRDMTIGSYNEKSGDTKEETLRDFVKNNIG